MKKNDRKLIITAILLFVFIVYGFIDAIINKQKSYSSIMGMNINRVYFYTFLLLINGSWLLYNKWFVGVGFLALASFSSYFLEYHFLHNYVASILIYIGIILDIIIRWKIKWLIPLIIIGIIQGIAFQTILSKYYLVLCMEFLSLCIGYIFILREIFTENETW